MHQKHLQIVIAIRLSKEHFHVLTDLFQNQAISGARLGYYMLSED